MDGVWKVNFDGEACRGGAGAGIWVRSLGGRNLNYSYRLAFDCTKNKVEYEAMVLVIQILKDFQVSRVMIHGYSEMVIKQITEEYQA